MARKERLNIFLMKEDVTEFEDIFKADGPRLTAIDLRPELPFEGKLYVRDSISKAPRWLSFVQAGASQALSRIFNSSASALLAIQTSDRTFCISFGYARNWIDNGKMERRFGLIVTLNSVDPLKIRSVDLQQYDTITRSTRTQTSRNASIENFGLDVRRDLMRSVTGDPTDKDFASKLTGADNLLMTKLIAFSELGSVCDEALVRFGQIHYRQHFPWVDHLDRVRDPTVSAELDRALVTAIQNEDLENLYLAPPRLVDPHDHAGFRFSYEENDAELHVDLDINEFLSGLQNRANIDIERIKRGLHIEQFVQNSDSSVDEFSFYDSIVFEIQRGGKLYALSYGEWFEIDNNYVRQVVEELAQVQEERGINLPAAQPTEIEERYNRRAANESAGLLALLDRQTVRYGGGRSSIEVCDLLSSNRHFIHVKPKAASATLSHLFSQGLVSAQCFRDPAFRQLARDVCPPSHRGIFVVDNPNPSDHTVVFAIITASPRPLIESLPFFSKQTLANAARELRNSGFRVSVLKIQRS